MIISNSEVDTRLRCRRQHYYSYALGLYPRKLSRANDIGLLGHHVLETYYRSIKEGAEQPEAYNAGMQQLILAGGHVDAEVISLISERFTQYCQFYRHEQFEVIDVEGIYKVPLNDRITYGLTLDLLVKYTEGYWKGQYVVIDHKFRYNFFTPDELGLHAQTFKYIWALRKQDYPIRHSILNQIRYRTDVKDTRKLFKREELTPTDKQLETIMRDHLAISEEIYEAKTQPVSWLKDNSPRRYYPRDCAGCYFRIPCRLELIGKDASKTFTNMFAPEDPSTFYRPYGY